MFSLRFHQLAIRLVQHDETAQALDFIRRARFRVVQFSTTTLNLPTHDYIMAGAWYHQRLVAILVAIRIHAQVAWVRVCALDSITVADHDQTVQALARFLIDHAPVPFLFYSGDQYDAWLADLLIAEGFVAHGSIIGFTATPIDIPPTPGVALIRPLHFSELSHAQHIDQHVFEMHWHKSAFELHELFHGHGLRIAALVDAQIVGYAIALWHDQESTLHLVRIAVHPDYQRQGIARQLLTSVMHHAYHHGAQRMTLNTQHDNYAAHALYTHHGFRMTGEAYHVLRATTRPS
ncbi:MAG: GNAT family N-acetyltransferase [Chloroflexi bacterium]|nr:GNAT family N-acetyltransferase [Chloroflexota bacterium]